MDTTRNSIIEAGDSGFSQYWDRLFENDPYQNPLYDNSSFKHPSEDQSRVDFDDRSFLVVTNDEPVFACSLTSHSNAEGKKQMGYFGLAASTHVNTRSMDGWTNNFSTNAISLMQWHIGNVIEKDEPDNLYYLDPISCGVMSPMTQVLLEKGAEPVLMESHMLDLTLSEQRLIRNLRTSYRSLIGWGKEEIQLRIIDKNNYTDTDLDNFQELHYQIEGRQLTPLIGNHSYESMISEDKGFLVQGYYRNKLISSAFFAHSPRTCYHTVSTSQQQLFDKPLSHAVVWTAILHGKKIGCKQFELGQPHYQDLPGCSSIDSATENNTAVNQLAKGFGGTAHSKLKVSMDLLA